MSNLVGIDLGTTYSAIARLDDTGRPEIIVNKEGENITPSIVLLESKTDVIVGSIAKTFEFFIFLAIIKLTEPMLAPISIIVIGISFFCNNLLKFSTFFSELPNKNTDRSIPSSRFKSHFILFLITDCFLDIKKVSIFEIIFAKNILDFVFICQFMCHKKFYNYHLNIMALEN